MTTDRGSDQHDHHPEVGEIISERRAASNRNPGRHQTGMLGDNFPESWATSPRNPQIGHGYNLADREARLLRLHLADIAPCHPA